ncbi:hypothetical protein HXX76_010007 [Chlamydomonas incerta]|uniref:Uncharacterized protein n=1 Tax=Chlamydomonas incerta TaxID=51695 RepID=A0A835VYN7_CHLIN|nr:hypothetical protein HXX76_010007 [Chlamydomonas incerta]|eukprot:KAG2430484.1 hypothetical protein HXX76_010007 [Chlamydomonas incerta]
MDQLTAELGAVKTQMAAMMSMLVEIKAAQDNAAHRNWNSMSRMFDHQLEPLKAEAGEQVGTYPPAGLFPASLSQLANMGHAELDALEQFYSRAFAGDSLARRYSKLMAFIGA